MQISLKFLFVLTYSILAIKNVVTLEDDIKYDIQWLGRMPDTEQLEQNVLDFRTLNNENFKCVVPDVDPTLNSKKSINDVYMPMHTIIKPLYDKKLCSYRIESYWIYEMCHGQYIRQYHETKQSGKRVVPQEFFLGYYHEKKQDKEYYEENGLKKTRIDWKYIDGDRLPAFSVLYTDGTNCDILNNKPRQTTVYYICDENGNDSVISFEEISSCTYEMIVASKWMCQHPSFTVPKEENKVISCYSMADGILKPKSLLEMEAEIEQSKNLKNKYMFADKDGKDFILQIKTSDDFSEMINNVADPNQIQNKEYDADVSPLQPPPLQQQKIYEPPQIDTNADRDVINSFLSGSHCLNGGTGWWKYEVCYGKHIKQYHEGDVNSPHVSIILGKWNKETHLNWLIKNPHKKPASTERSYVSLFFGDGDFCESVHKPRFVEVKLKCDKAKDHSIHAISFYIIEPMVCEYLLVVESPLLCSLITNSDDNGLFKAQQEQTP